MRKRILTLLLLFIVLGSQAQTVTNTKARQPVRQNDSTIQVDTLNAIIKHAGQGIFSYGTRATTLVQKDYFYVYGSCYCDLNGNGKKQYHVFFSPVQKQKTEYQIQRKFNKLIRERYTEWPEFDQGEIIKNGFITPQQADASKQITIHKYKVAGFEVHEFKW